MEPACAWPSRRRLHCEKMQHPNFGITAKACALHLNADAVSNVEPKCKDIEALKILCAVSLRSIGTRPRGTGSTLAVP